MKFSVAKSLIPILCEADGFDLRALALVNTALLREAECLSQEHYDELIKTARALPLDSSHAAQHPDIPAFKAENLSDAINTLLDTATSYPNNIGRQIQRVYGFAQLWPHCNRQERESLLRACAASIIGSIAPGDSVLNRAQLRAYQRNLNTFADAEDANASSLMKVLEVGDAEESYNILAQQLYSAEDIARVTRIIGNLGNRLLLHKFDRQGIVLDTVAGSRCLLQLLENGLRPEIAITLISQISHTLWWANNSQDVKSVHASDDHHEDLFTAICSGDMTSAARIARTVQSNEERSTVFQALTEEASHGRLHWTHSQRLLASYLYPNSDLARLDRDCFAALASASAANVYLRARGSEPYRRRAANN